MRKKIISLWMILVLVTGCSLDFNKRENKISAVRPEKNPITEKVKSVMKGMSLEEKIGQMLFVAYREPVFDDTVKSMLETVKPGGFILFQENFTDYNTSLDLVKEVKKTATIPMFIGIDQEGGLVQRLSYLKDRSVTKIPRMYDVGNKDDVTLTAEVARVLAEEMRVFGVNMDFAPSVDIYSNLSNTVIGKRSFGTSSEVVSKMGTIFGKALASNSIIPVYKHFPGHGNTSTDSHYNLPVVGKSLEELKSFELIPFQKAIDSGAEVMMIGHLAVPSITGDNTPSSLSEKMITNVLKEGMGYKGLVVTDAVNMEALTRHYTYAQIYEEAIAAGVDMILMPSIPEKAITDIKNSIAQGVFTEKRVDESVRKILTLKYKRITDTYNEYLPDTYLGSEAHKEVISKVNHS